MSLLSHRRRRHEPRAPLLARGGLLLDPLPDFNISIQTRLLVDLIDFDVSVGRSEGDPLSTVDPFDPGVAVQGLNSIEFQQDVQQNFRQITGHSVVQKALLKIKLKSLLKFN